VPLAEDSLPGCGEGIFVTLREPRGGVPFARSAAPARTNKWRISGGSRTIFVSIEDPQFVRGVQTGKEPFRKGDLLPGTSQAAPDHKVYPYLLRKLAITRTNQV
jgi:hypothetical protein